MSDLITLKVKSKTGQTTEIQVAEVYEIDGQPYRPASETEQMRQLYNHLTGRLSTLETLVTNLLADKQ